MQLHVPTSREFQSTKSASKQLQAYCGPSLPDSLRGSWARPFNQKECGRQLRQRLAQPSAALRIDRAAHLESAWQAQERAEALLAAEAGCSGVREVRSLAHLEALTEAAGPDVVAIAFYSRSCGACLSMMRRFDELHREALQQRAGVRFLKHDIRNEFDDLTDVARLYRVKATPSFAFFVGGAKVLEVRMRDTRSMTGSSGAIRSSLAAAEARLAAALRGVLFKTAPSARR